MAAGAAISVALEALRRVRAEAGERRAMFLADVSHCIVRDLDETNAAKRAVGFPLPVMADWAALDLFEGEAVRRAAMAHADPAKQPLIDDYLSRFPPRQDAPHGMLTVHRQRQSVVVPTITNERLRGIGFDDARITAINGLGTRSVLLVPFANSIVDGVLLLASSERVYDADDLALAERYCDRVCAALTNARLYSRSQAALRARDDFLRMASHELRTPLTALSLGCERLVAETRAAPRDVATTAERMLRASRRLSRLVTHLLDAVEVERQRLAIERAHCDIVPTVREAVDELVQTKHAGTDVVLALPDALVGEFDDDRVQQIVINLVDNALRYGGGQPVRVWLSRDGGDAVLSVADRGPGIPPELMPRLFEPYERGAPTQAPGGLGLGLYIVKQIVDAYGGQIDVRSGPEGAELIVRLPGADASPVRWPEDAERRTAHDRTTSAS